MRGNGGNRNPVATAAVPLLIAVLTVLAFWQLLGAEHTRRDARIGKQAGEVVHAIQARLSAYTDVLYGVRGLFEASSNVTRRDFHQHIHAVDVAERYPQLRVVGVAQLVASDDTGPFVRRVGRDAARSGLPYPPFRIRGRSALPRRLVIDYLEPQRGNEAAFGLDFYSEPNRRRAARQALMTGKPIATAPITLVQDPERTPGVDVFLPMQTGRTGGTAYFGFRVADLMRVAQPAGGSSDVQLEDIGPGAGGPLDERPQPQPTYSGRVPGGDDADHGATTRTFDILGRRWSLRYEPRRAVLSTGELAIPWIVLGGGLAAAALTVWLLTASVRTERRAVAMAGRMTADLRAAQQELERSNQELERFAYVASHDLREPLRSVTGFISLLSRRHGADLGDDARTWIAYALQGAERMNALIADLLEYSRAGRSTSGRAPRADLQAAWDRAVANLAAAIEESGATVTAGPLPTVAAEQREMNQVMQNLLGNAIKYRGDRAPVVHAGAERRDGGWAVSVRDNGIGIDPAHQDRIFVLFQRLHTRDDYEGTGMGLSIVKKIVEARGGSVAVESSPGEGSAFTVVLPAPSEAE